MLNYYTYIWNRADGTPYYVGKGSGNRAFRKHRTIGWAPPSRARIIVEHWDSEEDAYKMEKFYIRLFGRKDNGTGILRNLTDGGERPPLRTYQSSSTRRKIGLGNKGKIRSEEFKDNMRVKMRNNTNWMYRLLNLMTEEHSVFSDEVW